MCAGEQHVKKEQGWSFRYHFLYLIYE